MAKTKTQLFEVLMVFCIADLANGLRCYNMEYFLMADCPEKCCSSGQNVCCKTDTTTNGAIAGVICTIFPTIGFVAVFIICCCKCCRRKIRYLENETTGTMETDTPTHNTLYMQSQNRQNVPTNNIFQITMEYSHGSEIASPSLYSSTTVSSNSTGNLQCKKDNQHQRLPNGNTSQVYQTRPACSNEINRDLPPSYSSLYLSNDRNTQNNSQ